MAYKRELIINNGSLTSYKKLLKVSDVCQLLDKSKYPATTTINGVTFTNNGDGTITVNSLNITANAFYQLFSYPYIAAKKGHTYCAFSGANKDGGYFYVDLLKENGVWVTEITDRPVTVPNDNYSLRPVIVAQKNKPWGDKIYKPQLFDLTEMYGAGNEPKTVAEFKAKFPNDLYDYSPRCWVTSYKTGLIAKTKNLFDNILPANNCRVSFATSRAIATQIAADTDTTGLFKIVSYNGSSYEVLSWIRDVLTLGRITGTFTTPETTGYKHILFGLNGAKIDTTCLCEINLKPSTTYTFSCNFTNITQGSISWTDMQLEEGSTATNYVPYGYL